MLFIILINTMTQFEPCKQESLKTKCQNAQTDKNKNRRLSYPVRTQHQLAQDSPSCAV